MKAIQMLSKLTAEVINLEAAYVINGANLVNGKYSLLFPINHDSVLDGWFKAYYHYFCLYGRKDDEFLYLGEPDMTAFSNADDEEAIHFWIIED